MYTDVHRWTQIPSPTVAAGPGFAVDDRSFHRLTPWVSREVAMITTTVSSKFQVVIPLAVRKLLKIAPGDRFQVFPYQGRIELVPVRSVREMRGFLAGIATDIPRDGDRV